MSEALVEQHKTHGQQLKESIIRDLDKKINNPLKEANINRSYIVATYPNVYVNKKIMKEIAMKYIKLGYRVSIIVEPDIKIFIDWDPKMDRLNKK